MNLQTKEYAMNKNFRLLAIFAAIILIALNGASGQTAGDTAKDPVCGMSVKIAGAVHTAEYLGKSYYFCSDDCKIAFLKDPAKFASKQEAATPAAPAKRCCNMACHGSRKMSDMKMMPGQASVPPAPCAPPSPPAAAAPGSATPDCPIMKADEKPCCPMTGHGEMRMKRMHGMAVKPCMTGPGMADGCPLSGGLAGKADIVIENTADGIVVRISSKDLEAVKMIQKHAASMKAGCDPASCPKHEKAKE
jgi:YHS domain-containing protein